MMRTTPLRRMSLHLSHMRRTLERTFIAASGSCPAKSRKNLLYGSGQGRQEILMMTPNHATWFGLVAPDHSGTQPCRTGFRLGRHKPLLTTDLDLALECDHVARLVGVVNGFAGLFAFRRRHMVPTDAE